MLLENNENRNWGCGNNMSNCGCQNDDNCEKCKVNYGNGVNMSGAEMMDYDCDYNPQGINAAFGYNTANMTDNSNCGCNNSPEQCCRERQRIREEMIKQIKCLNFAVIELGLYLNTHSDDQRALCLHREYTKELKELKDKYQRVYGPLSIYYPCRKWRWLEEPWPWEGGNY